MFCTNILHNTKSQDYRKLGSVLKVFLKQVLEKTELQMINLLETAEVLFGYPDGIWPSVAKYRQNPTNTCGPTRQLVIIPFFPFFPARA